MTRRPRPRKAARNPLPRGYSRATISSTIARLRREGKSAAVASAAALSRARAAYRSRHKRGAFPAWLKRKAAAGAAHARKHAARAARAGARAAGRAAVHASKKAAGALARKLTLYASKPNPAGKAGGTWEVVVRGKVIAEFRGARARDMARKWGTALATANPKTPVHMREKP